MSLARSLLSDHRVGLQQVLALGAHAVGKVPSANNAWHAMSQSKDDVHTAKNW